MAARGKRRRAKQISPTAQAESFIKAQTDPGDIEKFWVNDSIHWGVRALRNFIKGEFLVEYRGHLCFSEPEDCCYKFEIQRGRKKMWIDASKDNDTLGRLINDDHRSPNAVTKLLIVNSSPYLCVFAAKDIEKGQEIRYNYGQNLYFPWRMKVLRQLNSLSYRVSFIRTTLCQFSVHK